VFHKKEPHIFDYNSHFLVDFYNSSTIGNRDEYSRISMPTIKIVSSLNQKSLKIKLTPASYPLLRLLEGDKEA